MSAKKMTRRAERALAFRVLYGLGFTPAASEADVRAAFDASPDKPESADLSEGFAWHLVRGVWSCLAELDAAIASFSQNWRVERLGKVEAAILRIAFFELMHGREDVPPKVAINEAVELSKQYSDERSRGFVNGVLDAAAKALETGTLCKQSTTPS